MSANQTEYMLDTSTFRGLPKAVFYSVPKTMTLVASPYCFWELLRHIDEPEQFSGFKQRMMRFKKVWVLGRAWREFEITPVDRIDADELIDGALAALEGSESLEGFYTSFIQDSSGALRLIEDCCARARDLIRLGDHRFLLYVREIAKVVSESNGIYHTLEEQHRGVMALISGYIMTREQGGLVNLDRDQIISRTYFYHSYVLMLAVRHAVGGRKISANDCRDAEMCKHLAPGGGICLVTSDTELLRGLQRSRESLMQGNPSLRPDEIVTSREQFQARIATALDCPPLSE